MFGQKRKLMERLEKLERIVINLQLEQVHKSDELANIKVDLIVAQDNIEGQRTDIEYVNSGLAALNTSVQQTGKELSTRINALKDEVTGMRKSQPHSGCEGDSAFNDLRSIVVQLVDELGYKLTERFPGMARFKVEKKPAVKK